MNTNDQAPPTENPLAQAPCSAFRALELCELWTRKDREMHANAPFAAQFSHRLNCIAEGQSDVQRLEARITSLQQDMRTILSVTRWDHQAHQIAKRALTPNGPDQRPGRQPKA